MTPRTLALAALALLAAGAPTAAQTVTGTVTDTAGMGLANVFVEVVTERQRVIASAQSDSAGHFQIPVGRGGRFQLRLSHLAYAPVTARLDEVRQGDVLEVKVMMVSGAIALEPVVVTARSRDNITAFYERAQRPGFGHFVTREWIESRKAARATDLLREVAPVEIVRVPLCGGCPAQNMVFLRTAFGHCTPTVYIDGFAMKQDPGVSLDAIITAPMLEGIEVYRGVYAPPPLEARTQCGVVAFWTRQDSTGPVTAKRILTFGGIGGTLLLLSLLLLRL